MARHAVEPEMCGEPPREGGRQLPNRTREWHTVNMSAPGTCGTDVQPIKHHRRVSPDDRPEVLWARWRQMEPRRRERT